MEETEEWADISWAPTYQVSTLGRVRSKGTGGRRSRVLATSTCWQGYHRVCVRANGKVYGRPVHRLVIETFRGPCPPGMECDHRDGDHTNNRLSNLEWVTHSENMRRARNGPNAATWYGVSPGTLHWNCKITPDIVRDIRRRVASGEMQKDVARHHGITRASVCLIVNRKNWRHLE